MSEQAQPLTRTEKATNKLQDRLGACGCGTCRCDLFQGAGRKDGFEVCDCGHTRWSHARVRNTVSS